MRNRSMTRIASAALPGCRLEFEQHIPKSPLGMHGFYLLARRLELNEPSVRTHSNN